MQPLDLPVTCIRGRASNVLNNDLTISRTIGGHVSTVRSNRRPTTRRRPRCWWHGAMLQSYTGPQPESSEAAASATPRHEAITNTSSFAGIEAVGGQYCLACSRTSLSGRHLTIGRKPALILWPPQLSSAAHSRYRKMKRCILSLHHVHVRGVGIRSNGPSIAYHPSQSHEATSRNGGKVRLSQRPY